MAYYAPFSSLYNFLLPQEISVQPAGALRLPGKPLISVCNPIKYEILPGLLIQQFTKKSKQCFSFVKIRENIVLYKNYTRLVA